VLNGPQDNINGFSVDGDSFTFTQNSISCSLDVPDIGEVDFQGTYNPSTGQWTLSGQYPGPIECGYVELTNLQFTLTSTCLNTSCDASFVGIPALANAHMTGQIYSNGLFTTTVDAHALQIAGFTLSTTDVTLTNDNPSHLLTLTVVGNLGALGLNIPVGGVLQANGNYALTSSASLTVAGFTVSNVTYALSNAGLTATGVLAVPAGLGTVGVSGSISSDGTYSLTGIGDVYPCGFHLASAVVTLNNSGLAASGMLQVTDLGAVQVSGSVKSNGAYSLTGSGTLSPAGFNLLAVTMTATNGGITVSGTLQLPDGIGSVAVSGSVNNNGTFSLSGNGSLSLRGYSLGSASVTVTNNGASVSGSVGVTDLGSISVSGSVNSDGSFSVSGSNDLGSITVSNNGVSVNANNPIKSLGSLLGL